MDEYPPLEARAERYAAQLRKLGASPEIEADERTAELQFERSGETFYLETTIDDPARVSLTIAYELEAAAKSDRARLRDLALQCAAQSIGIVVGIDESGDVEFRHDAFVQPDLSMGATLPRILQELHDAQERFFSAL